MKQPVLCVEIGVTDPYKVELALEFVSARIRRITMDRPLDASDGPKENAREIVIAPDGVQRRVGDWWIEMR